MTQVITATFEDGVLKPNERLNLQPHSRVRVAVELLEDETEVALRQRAWETIERLWRECAIDSQGERLTREQLHERR
jgi:predicted DNA-binding antitoxin AbrB/MazE fold protein